MRRSEADRTTGPAPPGPTRASLRGDGGYVTAETAMVLPVLVLFTAMLVWGVLAAVAELRCVDAARAGARAAARSEPDAAVLATARRAGPSGARVRVVREKDLVRVEVEAPLPGPGALASLLSVDVGAKATALDEATLTGETP